MSETKFLLKAVKGDKQRGVAGTVKVGRGALDGILLTDKGTSREHALLTVAGNELFVEDTHSTNHTYVNQAEILARTRLSNGDIVKFATEEFIVQCIDAANETIVIVANSEAAKKRGPGWISDVPFDDRDHTQQCSPEQLQDLLRRSDERRRANLAAPPVKEPCLIFYKENAQELVVPLPVSKTPEQEWIVGRQPECDIHIDARSVSGIHAKILRRGIQWWAIDALSANGMFVNNFQAGKQFLTSGDAIRFGDVECIFRLPGRMRALPQRERTWILYASIVLGICIAALGLIWAAIKFWPKLQL